MVCVSLIHIWNPGILQAAREEEKERGSLFFICTYQDNDTPSLSLQTWYELRHHQSLFFSNFKGYKEFLGMLVA